MLSVYYTMFTLYKCILYIVCMPCIQAYTLYNTILGHILSNTSNIILTA